MAESTTTRSTLPDDVVGEILLRLDDLATLFRCATTCKSWRHLVAKPYFLLRRKWPPSIAGFFTMRGIPGMIPTARQLIFVPFPGPSLFGTRPRVLSSFIRGDDAAPAAFADSAVPLATRGGLLLVRLYTRVNHRPGGNPIVGLAVCNLLAGKWDVLPELNCQSGFGYHDRYGHDIVPSIAGDGSPAFKVLMIGKDKSHFNLHTFASGKASWRAPTKCFNMDERQVWAMVNTEAVVCQGYAHWLFISNSNHFHVLNVDVKTGHVSLTKLLRPTQEGYCPANGDLSDYYTEMARLDDLRGAHYLVTTCNGTRLSLCTYRGRRLEIWTPEQEDGHKSGDGDAHWVRTREIDHKLTELIQQLERPSCIWLGERSGILLIRVRDSLYTADLNTGTLADATDQFCGHACSRIMLPMEIDWLTYFMVRLGGS